ncbi:MAG TPA: ABC transporter permease [Firmicutes bacterium]|jgi:ribose transport system permease protein|nr:ABC transporter permease [Bacillota bacterium]
MNLKIRDFLNKAHWFWTFAGSMLLWIFIGVLRSNLNLNSLLTNAIAASFLAIAAIGQMFVVTTGGGAIDLSIPSVITLSAFIATGMINGSDAYFLPAVLLVMIIGAVIGIFNSIMVVYLKIPPIIATLATGNIVTTGYLLYNEHFTAFSICPILLGLTRGQFLGIPLLIYFLILIAGLVAFVLGCTTYGRSLIAVGQNMKAAYLAGVKTDRTIIIAYIISGVFSGLAGILISARVGGAFLDMGSAYLMQTIGAVVLGGTLIFGGRATMGGTIFGSLFLILLVTAMQIAGLSIGQQRIFEGILIIAVLMLASNRRAEE